MVRQLTDEPYRIRKQERQVLDGHLADGGVQGCKKFVLREHIGFGEQVHQGRFADVGITY